MTARRLVALLALAGVFLATYLTLYKLGYIGELSCSVGSCETVQTSQWATFLGLPVAAWGIGFYVTVFALALAGSMGPLSGANWVGWALLVVTGWGVIFSGWLTYLELFVIDAICQWCVVSAVLATVLFGLVLYDRPWVAEGLDGDEEGEDGEEGMPHAK